MNISKSCVFCVACVQGNLQQWLAKDMKALMMLLDLGDWFPMLIAQQLSVPLLVKSNDSDLMELTNLVKQPMRFGQARMLLHTVRHIHEYKALPAVVANRLKSFSVSAQTISSQFFRTRPNADFGIDPTMSSLWNVDDVKTMLESEQLPQVAHVCEAERVNGFVLLSCTNDHDLTRLGASTVADRVKLRNIITKLNSIHFHIASESQIPTTVSSVHLLSNIPDDFVCPITHELMVDPVLAADGFTYERHAITKWIAANTKSPMTNQELDTSALFPNRILKSQIREWSERNQTALAAENPGNGK
jgi:hypothetical protein